jgi:hypothetical protein
MPANEAEVLRLHRLRLSEERRMMAFTDPPLSGAQFQAALEAIRSYCEQRLRHLGEVFVTQHDHAAATGVGLKLHDRTGGYFRHAVVGESSRALSDPIEFADAAVGKILAWYGRRRPGEPSPEGQEELL